MDLSTARRHPLVLGTVVALVSVLAASAAAVAVAAIGNDGPTAPKVDTELHFLPKDNEQPLVTPDRTGTPVPTASFLTLQGRPASLAQYRGKPLVVNFFGSWCVPCRKETPALQALHAELGDRVTFLGLAIHDSQRSAQAYADEMGVTYDVGRDTSDQLFMAFGAVTPPSTYLVSADGRIVADHVGAVTMGQLRTLLRDNFALS
jgi:thiol-disulfide isomerase/thioredoxin